MSFLKPILVDIGELIRDGVHDRVRIGRRISGAPFPRKKDPRRNRPHGVSKPKVNGIFPLLRHPEVTIRPRKTSVLVLWKPLVDTFDRLNGRKVVGMTRKQERQARRLVLAGIKKEAQRLGLVKR